MRFDSFAHMRVPVLSLALCLTHCTLDSSPTRPTSGVTAEGTDPQQDSAGDRTSLSPLGASGSGAQRDQDAARINTGQDSQQSPSNAEEDAGATDATHDMPSAHQDAGANSQPAEPTEPAADDTTAPASMTVDPDCTRDALRTSAEAYMQALTAGDPSRLRLHPALRYTENGQEQRLGAGVWLRSPRVEFSRHIFDELRCSSITEAVLSSRTGAIVFGVRLLYRDGQLLEVEAHVVPDTLARIDVNAIIPIGNDRFVEPVPEDRRMSREELEAYADRYFESAASGGEVPPSAPDCRRRQNGVPFGDGLCNRPPGVMRFMERRYPAVDEVLGVIAASVIYDNYLGLYLIKMAGDVVQSIEVVGGAATPSSGW